MIETLCPECEGALALQGIETGEIVACPDCGVDLEVIGVAPISLALAPQEEEDWGE